MNAQLYSRNSYVEVGINLSSCATEEANLIRQQSHYISPIRNPAKEESYVQNFPHEAWLLLSQYYIQRYKSGSFPDIMVCTFFDFALSLD